MSVKITKIQLTLFLIIVTFPFIVTAQSITGFVKDATTKAPLIGVNVFVDGTTIGTTTDEKGFYRIEVESFPMVLTFSYLGYGSRKVAVSKSSVTTISVNLKTVASNLPAVIISAKPKIDTVYKERYSVIDYEFFDEYILLLVYRGVRKRYSVLLINHEGKEIFEESLGQAAPVGFYKGCLGAVYFLTGSSARQVYIEQEKLYFYNPVNLFEFEAAAYPCQFAANNYVYFQSYFTKGQIVQYYRIHKDSIHGTKEHFIHVIDKSRARMADDEFAFQNMVSELEQFAARPISIGEQLSNPSFLSRVVFEPIYAPLFPLADTLLLFNHRFHKIEYYFSQQNKQTNTLQFKTIPIEYALDKKWKKEIIRDEDTKQFYTLYDTRWGYKVKRIDIQNGTTTDLIELDRAFVSNIKIKGGFLYFLENNFRKNDPIAKLQKVRIE